MFVLIGSLLLQSRVRVNTPAVLYMIAYLMLAAMSVAVGSGWRGDASNFDLIVIILTIASTFMPVVMVRPPHIKGIFVFTLALFAWSQGQRTTPASASWKCCLWVRGAATTSGYNSNEGLLGPVYAIFFYGVGAGGHFGLALLMVILGGKRIGLLATIVGIFMLAFFKRRAPSGRAYMFVALFAIMISINFLAISASWISDYTADALGKSSVHIEEVMLGRYMNTKIMTEYSLNRELLPFLFGAGVGSATAAILADLTGLLPHNDWLKILLDYGLIGSILITACMAFIFSCTPIGCALGVVTSIIMMTDNILIYLFYQIPVALMVGYTVLHPVPSWPTLLGRVLATVAFCTGVADVTLSLERRNRVAPRSQVLPSFPAAAEKLRVTNRAG